MNDQKGENNQDQTTDTANNDVGPTEELREPDKSDGELSAPGVQNPESEEIKDEKGPNTE